MDEFAPPVRELEEYKTTLAKKVACRLGRFKSTPFSSCTYVGSATVLKYWSLLTGTVPHRPIFRSWNDVDLYYGRLLFDQNYWNVAYEMWKSNLRLRKLPYFNKDGHPTSRCKVAKVVRYVRRMCGSARYPDVSDLYSFATLITDASKMRKMERFFIDDPLERCPCKVSAMHAIWQLGLDARRQNTVEAKAAFVHLTAQTINAVKKCIFHYAYEHQTVDDDCLQMVRRHIISKTTRKARRRSNSLYPGFHRPQ